jgi:hypothetical protein
MDTQFHIIRQNRLTFIRLIDSLTPGQLNEIPEGFNNNIAWNFAHIVVTQQVLCYMKAGVSPRINQAHIEKYQKGTRPGEIIGAQELEFFKKQAITLIDEFEKDWNAGLFKSYQAFTTSMGVPINTCEEALHYAAGHDQLHFGYTIALKRVVLNKSVIA